MHNGMLRDEKYIHRLIETLYEQYGIAADSVTPANRGYYGETWKVCADTGLYFLKMDYFPFHQEKFRQSLSVIEYLCENGIDFVGRVIKTRENALYSNFDGAIIGLFEWVECENIETDDTKTAEYQMLCKIYRLTKPGLEIPSASFSDAAAIRFYEQWEVLKKAPGTASNRAVLAVFERFTDEFSHCASRLSQIAGYCQGEIDDFYLTHGDAGGNFFIGNGKNYILDWDEAMYAPIERDAWVMGCYDWARKLFNDTLKANHIPYRLREERLAFYCYHMYFYYLVEFLMAHPICDKSQQIAEYLKTDGWIKSRIQYADTVCR